MENVVVWDIDADPLGAIRSSKGNTTVIVELNEPVPVSGAATAMAFDLLGQINGSMPVWIYQENATVPSTVAWIKAGASQVLASLTDTEHAIRQAIEENSLDSGPSLSAREPQRAVSLVGGSRSTRNVSASIALVAGSRCNVLIEGETGTGKEVVAREIHASGLGRRGPWIAAFTRAFRWARVRAEATTAAIALNKPEVD